MQRGVHFASVFLFVFFILIGFILIFFACFHYNDFWSLFSILALIIGYNCPALCFGYDDPNMQEYRMKDLYPETRTSLAEMGWAFGGIFYLVSFLPPVLAWYNAHLGWAGVVMVFMALTVWMWAYIMRLRIFIFY